MVASRISNRCLDLGRKIPARWDRQIANGAPRALTGGWLLQTEACAEQVRAVTADLLRRPDFSGANGTLPALPLRRIGQNTGFSNETGGRGALACEWRLPPPGRTGPGKRNPC